MMTVGKNIGEVEEIGKQRDEGRGQMYEEKVCYPVSSLWLYFPIYLGFKTLNSNFSKSQFMDIEPLYL